MKNVISISEVVGSREESGSTTEIVATADAVFDEGKSELVTRVGSFLRPVDLCHKEHHFTADWLPRSETIREGVSLDEAVPLAKEIFHRWVLKVRQAAPSLANR